jgi:broad specificity phosphatase PhoE
MTGSDKPSLTARILLVRHGPSSHIHDGRWLRHHEVQHSEDAYDAAGIRDDSMPPAELLDVTERAELIVASDLARAIVSADRLAPRRDVVHSALLREIRLEPPRWIPVALPIDVWDAFSHAQWTYRLFARSAHEFMTRGDAAAAWLEQHARSSRTIVVVTHAGFRRILASRLVARGWRADLPTRNERYANWSSWEFAQHG